MSVLIKSWSLRIISRNFLIRLLNMIFVRIEIRGFLKSSGSKFWMDPETFWAQGGLPESKSPVDWGIQRLKPYAANLAQPLSKFHIFQGTLNPILYSMLAKEWRKNLSKMMRTVFGGNATLLEIQPSLTSQTLPSTPTCDLWKKLMKYLNRNPSEVSPTDPEA